MLHHERTTPSQLAAINHQSSFRAKIAASAEARRIKVIPTQQAEPAVPQPVEIKRPAVVYNFPSCSCADCTGRPPEPSVARLDTKTIQMAVCEHFHVSYIDMISERRTANVVRPRQIAMYLAKTLTLRSLPEIGRRFGGRNHTTIIHGVRKIETLVALDPELDEQIQILKEKLSAI